MKKITYALSGLILLLGFNAVTFGGDRSYILFSHPTAREAGKIEAVGDLKDSLNLIARRENWAMPDGKIFPVDRYTLEVKTASDYPIKLYFGQDKALAYQYRETLEAGGVVLDISGCRRDRWEEVRVFDVWRRTPLHPDISTNEAAGGKQVERITMVLKRRAYWVTDFDEDAVMITSDLDLRWFNTAYRAAEDKWNFVTEAKK